MNMLGSRFRLVALLLASLVALSGCLVLPPVNPGEPPDPSELDGNGPLTVASEVVVAEEGQGFRRGTVYYPTDAPAPVGSMVAVSGLGGSQSSLAWMGERIASYGFAVMVIDTFTLGDRPTGRADQLIAAREWMSAQTVTPGSPLFGVIDPSRYAYTGYSIGGGGALIAGRRDPGALALLPIAGFNEGGTNFSDVTIPSLVMACANDFIAPNVLFSRPFYDSLSGPKAYLTVTGSHFCPTSGRAETRVLGRYMIAFLKYSMDGDASYAGYLCEPAPDDPELVRYLSTIC